MMANDFSEPAAPATEALPKTRTPKKGFLLTLTGFTKTSILVLWLLTAGYFSFFCAVHLIFLLPNGKWDAPLTQGERFWVLQEGLWPWLNQIHLWSVIPAGILLPLQFIPGMRRRYIDMHRVSGHVLFILLTIGSITGWKMSMTAFSGTTHTKLYGTILALSCAYGTYQSVTSIRRLQIDQHRIWVLRTWSYAGSILSLRMFLLPTFFAFAYFSIHPTSRMNCAEISYLYHENFKYNATLLQQQIASMHLRYPGCLDLTIPAIENYVPVEAKVLLHGTPPERATALSNIIFGACGLAGFFVNILAVETYIYCTKGETERLKKVSEARRKAAASQELVTKKLADRVGDVVEKETLLQENMRQRRSRQS